EGPGDTFEQTVPANDPTPLQLDRVFDQAGKYTVRMQMKVTGPLYPVVTALFAAKAKILVVEDTTPPDTLIDTGPVADSKTSDPTPTFTSHAPEPGSPFECSLDTGPPSSGPCSGPEAAHTPASPLADGTYTFRVRATDAASNADSSPATRTFTVDTT